MLSITSAIQWPICWNSATPKPRVVPAGVPSRTPEVMVKGAVSNGTPFLLQVIRACSSAASVALPVTPLGRRSTSIRWLSVPPDTIAAPRSTSTAARAWAFVTTWRA